VFVGYAGWVGGQIEDELEAGAWIVADRADRDAFTDHPESLWRTVLGRQHGPVAWLVHFPDDPSSN
jgi:putative transcriptional regulator